MTNTKTTKRALFASIFSILLCVSMLIGSTFAWFTDTASTGVNKIVAGTLDIQLLDADGNDLEGQTLNFKKAAGFETEDILWEPGCTYDLPEVFVKNNGNLALKYKVVITGINGDAKLNEVIEWTINNATVGTEYSLAAGATSSAITIKGHMKEEANNDYQGLSIDGISIAVYATQDTVEHDSTTDQYDAAAGYPITSAAELMEVLNNIQPNQLVNINSTTPIEFNGALADGVTVAGQGKDKTTIVIPNNGGTGYIINNEDVTFSDVKIDGTAVTNKNGYNAVLEVKKDGTKIDNCEITGGGMSTWNSSVLVMGSAAGDKTEVTNTKISGAFRGILLESGNGDLNVDGCDITAIYPISVDGASATTNITVSNSKLNGWTSYSSVNSVSFNNVQFGFGCGYGYLKAYSSTSFDGCSFADGFKMGCGFTTAHTYTLNNCTYNGVKITATNFLTTLFDKDDSGEFNTLRNNATVIVDGVTVTLA